MHLKKPFIIIDPAETNHESLISEFNNDVKSGKHIFLFLFLDDCNPCNATKPKWTNIKKYLKKEHLKNDDIVIAQINQKLFNNLNGVGSEPMGYPSLRYIKSPTVEEYEDCNISNKDRSSESFAEWIKSKVSEKNMDGGKTKHGGRKTKRRGGKWSLKYKRTINCRRPKGFSQRQHCKYGRKTWKHKY
jgi:heme-degrading monooxygenase HmoA